MKTIRFTKYNALLSTALALALHATPAQAGPGPALARVGGSASARRAFQRDA